MEQSKLAIVMNGGGSRGSFVVGALEYIQKNVIERFPRLSHIEYNTFFGASTNAFTALMMSMEKYEALVAVWDQLGKDQPRLPHRFHYAWKMLTGSDNISSSIPLEKFVRKYVRLKDIRKRVLLPLASFRDGQYYTLSDDDFQTDEDLQNAVIASLRIPGYNPPVKEVKTKYGVIEMVVDGSALWSNPVGSVLAYDPDAVFVISTMPCRGSRFSDLSLRVPGRADVVSMARAMYLEAAPETLFSRDVEEFLRLNDLAKEAQYQDRAIHTVDGDELRYYNTVVICPSEQLADIRDYSPALLKEQRNMGYTEAQRVFKDSPYMRTDAAPNSADTPI